MWNIIKPGQLWRKQGVLDEDYGNIGIAPCSIILVVSNKKEPLTPSTFQILCYNISTQKFIYMEACDFGILSCDLFCDL